MSTIPTQNAFDQSIVSCLILEKEGIFCDNTALEPVCDQDNRQHPNPCLFTSAKNSWHTKGFVRLVIIISSVTTEVIYAGF